MLNIVAPDFWGLRNDEGTDFGILRRSACSPTSDSEGGRCSRFRIENGDETLVVVQEVEARVDRRSIDIADMVGRIREAVANEHEVFARHVALIRSGRAAEDDQRQNSTRRRAPALAREQARSPDLTSP